MKNREYSKLVKFYLIYGLQDILYMVFIFFVPYGVACATTADEVSVNEDSISVNREDVDSSTKDASADEVSVNEDSISVNREDVDSSTKDASADEGSGVSNEDSISVNGEDVDSSTQDASADEGSGVSNEDSISVNGEDFDSSTQQDASADEGSGVSNEDSISVNGEDVDSSTQDASADEGTQDSEFYTNFSTKGGFVKSKTTYKYNEVKHSLISRAKKSYNSAATTIEQQVGDAIKNIEEKSKALQNLIDVMLAYSLQKDFPIVKDINVCYDYYPQKGEIRGICKTSSFRSELTNEPPVKIIKEIKISLANKDSMWMLTNYLKILTLDKRQGLTQDSAPIFDKPSYRAIKRGVFINRMMLSMTSNNYIMMEHHIHKKTIQKLLANLIPQQDLLDTVVENIKTWHDNMLPVFSGKDVDVCRQCIDEMTAKDKIQGLFRQFLTTEMKYVLSVGGSVVWREHIGDGLVTYKGQEAASRLVYRVLEFLFDEK